MAAVMVPARLFSMGRLRPLLHGATIGLRHARSAALISADLRHASPLKRPVAVPEMAEHQRLRALSHLDETCAATCGELQAALLKLAGTLRDKAPIKSVVDSFVAVGALLGPTSSADLPGAERAIQSVAVLDRLISERAAEMGSAQLAATVRVFASCGIEALHSSQATALQIRREIRVHPAHALEHAVLPLGTHMSTLATRRLIGAAVHELACRPDVPADVRPVSRLPSRVLAAIAPFIVRWRSQLRSFAERDPAERALGQIFETLARGAHAEWLVGGAAHNGGGQPGHEPLCALLVALEELGAIGDVTHVAPSPADASPASEVAVADAAPAAPLAHAATSPPPDAPPPSASGGAREAHQKASHAYMRAQARALFNALSRAARAAPERLDDGSLGAMIEARAGLALREDVDETLEALCDEWQRRIAARPLAARALGGVLKLARSSRRHSELLSRRRAELLDPLVDCALEQLREEAAARAEADGVTLEPNRRPRGRAALRLLLSEPLEPPQLAALACASAAGLGKRDGRNASAQQHNLFAELAARLAVDAQFGAALDSSLAVDLLVNMCRVGLGSAAGANAVLARVVTADGGLRAAHLSNGQLGWLMCALGTTGTAGAEADSALELARRRADGANLRRDLDERASPSAPRARAPVGFERANWLWRELTLLTLERMALEPRSRMQSRDSVRALWGICQAGRYAPRPLAELSAAVVDALRPLEHAQPIARPLAELSAARGAAGAARDGSEGGTAPAHKRTGSQPRERHSQPPGEFDSRGFAMVFASLAALEIEMPAALPALEPAGWAALQSWWEHSVTRMPPRVSTFQLELSAALETLGVAHDVEQIVELPLRHAALRYTVDIRLRGLPVVIEAHGTSHLLWQGAQRYTTQKHRLLRARGFRVVEIYAPEWNSHRSTLQRPALQLHFLAEALADEAGLLTDAVGTLARPPVRALTVS
jgi:hypothetical protein